MRIRGHSSLIMWLSIGLVALIVSIQGGPIALAEDGDARDNAGWEEIGAGSASGHGISNTGVLGSIAPSLAIGQNGLPVVAWSGGGYGIYVLRWDGSAWVEMGPNSASEDGVSNQPGFIASEPSLVIGPSGLPSVAWHLEHTRGSVIQIRRWNGSAWAEIGTGSGTNNIISYSNYSTFPSLAVSSNGQSILAWAGETGENSQIYVSSWNGLDWDDIGAISRYGGGISKSTGLSIFPSLAIGPDNNPVIAWTDDSSGNLEIYVRRWDGKTWAEMGEGSASGGGISNNKGSSGIPSLVIGADGKPVVAWMDDTSGNWQVYVRKWDGATWAEIGPASATSGGISRTFLASGTPSLAVGPDDLLMIAWEGQTGPDSYEIYARRWNGSNWVEVGEGSASGGGISNNKGDSFQSSLAIGPDGVPVVAWTDTTGGDREIYIRRYSPQCSPLTLARAGRGEIAVTYPTVSGGCPEGEFDNGHIVRFLATRPAGWRVKRWAGTDNDASRAIFNTITMPGNAHEVRVIFEQTPPWAAEFLPE